MAYFISRSHSLTLDGIHLDYRNLPISLEEECDLEHLNLIQSSFFPCKDNEETPIQLKTFRASNNSEWPVEFEKMSQIREIKLIEEGNNRVQKHFLSKFLARKGPELRALSEVRQPNRWQEGLLPTPPAR